MNESILYTRGVGRCFSAAGGPFWALKGIDVDIPQGALTILKGRSGSGKTTLMNILGLLDAPTEGEIIFAGRSMVKASERQRTLIRRKEIGFVFQSVALIPMMNAYENVEFALRMSRYKGNRQERAVECLKMVGLGQRMKHMPQEMSGGEQQRVAIARAIAHHPKVLFADEPTAELDTLTGLQVFKIFKELAAQEGITIVATTHDTNMMSIGDAVYELEGGELVHGDE